MDEKKVNNICLLMVLVITFTTIVLVVNNSNIIQNIYDTDKTNFVFLILIIFNFLYSLLSVLFLPFLKLIEKIYINKNENYPNTIEYEYYRDIINNYSILSLSKCYNEETNYKDIFVATLLKLKLTKKIDTVNDEIIVLDEDNLLPSERNFIIMLKSGKGGNTYPKKEINFYLAQDLDYENKSTLLFDTKKHELSRYIRNFLGILWFINFAFLIIYGLSDISGKIRDEIVLMSFICHFLTLFLGIYYQNRKKVMFRTEKGKELQNKLIGLRNFINHFGNINSKQIEEVYIWEYYIIYAIIFNQKGNLNSDTYNFYKKYIDKYLY